MPTKSERSTKLEITPFVSVRQIESGVHPSGITKRVELTLRDGSKTLVTVFYCASDAQFELGIVPEFLNEKIELDNELLISQANTLAAWKTQVGEKPEKFVVSGRGEIIFCPTNAGWQREAFWIRNGKIELIMNDANLTGEYDVLALKDGIWSEKTIQIQDGKAVKSQDNRSIDVGFNMPFLVREGQIVDLNNIIADPRFRADLRNVFNFAFGRKVPDEFWLFFRKLLPVSASAAKRIQMKKSVVHRPPTQLSAQELERFDSILQETGLSILMQVRPTKQGSHRLVICDQVPENRIPCFGVGHDEHGKLIVVAADGRQQQSAGLTVTELSHLMVKVGIVNGGLGSAGGDVALVKKNGDQHVLLNSPSNKSINGVAQTRPVPAVLICK